MTKTSNKNLNDDSKSKHDLKKHQMTSNDLIRPQKCELTDSSVNRTMNKKSKMRSGSLHEICLSCPTCQLVKI